MRTLSFCCKILLSSSSFSHTEARRIGQTHRPHACAHFLPSALLCRLLIPLSSVGRHSASRAAKFLKLPKTFPKHTGVLSLITLILQFVGGVARLELSSEVDDYLIIGNTCLATALNLLLLLQVLMYAQNTKSVMEKKRSNKYK